MSFLRVVFVYIVFNIQLEYGFGYKCDAITASSCTKDLNNVMLSFSKFTNPKLIEEKCRGQIVRMHESKACLRSNLKNCEDKSFLDQLQKAVNNKSPQCLSVDKCGKYVEKAMDLYQCFVFFSHKSICSKFEDAISCALPIISSCQILGPFAASISKKFQKALKGTCPNAKIPSEFSLSSKVFERELLTCKDTLNHNNNIKKCRTKFDVTMKDAYQESNNLEFYCIAAYELIECMFNEAIDCPIMDKYLEISTYSYMVLMKPFCGNFTNPTENECNILSVSEALREILKEKNSYEDDKPKGAREILKLSNFEIFDLCGRLTNAKTREFGRNLNLEKCPIRVKKLANYTQEYVDVTLGYCRSLETCYNRNKEIDYLETCINGIVVNQTTDGDYCKAVEMVLDCLAETKCQEVANFYKFINKMEIQSGISKCFNDSKLHTKLLISISDISRWY
ncbi:DgyrCDS9562 [Dimorphilus gyrociliatus]|uniref:DgyrCDS9562 n=1 Tax=Dimorphilus gyrociliatus TaxID=2664684 RepID=A0A7I8VXC4_9ANNE|nr:DgyrCDS9562 [Dimorphilus gyrociliatus]